MRLKSDVNIKNRRAGFDYEILDRYMAGIQLFGTEIKSIRESKASLADTFCQFVGGELWVKQMHIAEYRFGSYANHESKRDRKLLLQKKELRKLERLTRDTGENDYPAPAVYQRAGVRQDGDSTLPGQTHLRQTSVAARAGRQARTTACHAQCGAVMARGT